MPEGHTIHRLAADLASDLVGHALAASSPQQRFVGVERVDGKVLRRTEAVGKHLFLHFVGGSVVHVHLGLFGRFYRRKNPAPEPRATTRMRLVGPTVTWDLVGPTRCERLTPTALKALRARLGADPLSDGDAKTRKQDLETAWKRFHATKRPVGAVLLDQRIVSGIGNVYRAELLFLLRLHPATPASRIDKPTFTALWKLAGELLARGVAERRIVTVPRVAGGPKRVKRGDALYVYKRRECRQCGSAIVTSTLGARRMYACETCQPPAPSEEDVRA